MDTLEKAALLAAAEVIGTAAGDAPATGATDAPEAHSAHAAVAGGSEVATEVTDATGQDAGHDDYGPFVWPDGYTADPETLARFVPVARRLGLSKSAAQELAGLYAELDLERGRRQAEFIAKNNDGWLREIHAHPEFGGSRLPAAGENVAAVMRRFGSPLLTAQIRQMNVQNWPEMFYFLARVAGALAEDSSPGSAGSGEPAGGQSAAQILFPGLK